MLNYRAEEDKEANNTVSARVMSIFIATRDEAQARALALVEGGGTVHTSVHSPPMFYPHAESDIEADSQFYRGQGYPMHFFSLIT